MICVLDSSVWVSAFHFGGIPLAALRSAAKHRIAICEAIRDEVSLILTAKFKWPLNRVQAAFDELDPHIFEVAIPGQIRGICRDPKDDMVLECAIGAGADVIVTGDKDLLTLGKYENIRVLTPRAFLEEFGDIADRNRP